MSAGWLERVAERAGVSVHEAHAALIRRGISPDRPLRPARRITLTRIAFQGAKQGRAAGPFAFTWSDLKPGIWGLASYDNLVGKSSVLEIVLWVLRGEPKALQVDVRGWLRTVAVGFQVDDQPFAVEFELDAGVPSGALWRETSGGRIEIDRFASEAGFAAAMAQFMMDELDLDRVPARQGGDGEGGQTVVHGWNALSGALYFGGDHKLLLGDIQWGGLPARMLQMFVGIPWARAVMQASTAEKAVAQETTQAERAATALRAYIEAARRRIEGELDAARRRLLGLPDEIATAEQLEALSVELAELLRSLHELERRFAQLAAEASALRTMADEDEGTLRDLRENVLAQRFFNGLSPTCCPRCETAIGSERRQREATVLCCSLCSEPIAPERTEETSEDIEGAERRRDASQAAADRAEALFASLQAERDRVAQRLAEVQGALAVAARGTGFRERREAELEVARLEGALRERTGETPTHRPPADTAVINAARAEAKAEFDAAKGDLLSALNEEILRLGRSFGVGSLEEVSLDAQARMRLRKGGEQTAFSHLSPGERLRLRIATAVALLRVGRSYGVGRHPGLIIIDSPGAEETTDHDLGSLLRELCAVSEELPELQVFVASANAAAVIGALDANHCRIAERGQFLW